MPNATSAYELARERYAELGVDAEAALGAMGDFPISLHCWQGDDVGGFENAGGALGGGLAVTGNYPGKAREESKTLPLGAVWDEHCRRSGAPVGLAWLDAVRAHKRGVQSKRR